MILKRGFFTSQYHHYTFKVDEEEVFEINLDDDTVVDPLSKEITVTDKDLPVDSKSVKSVESRSTNLQFDPNDMVLQQAGVVGGCGVTPGGFDQDPSYFIPVYEGEVISLFTYCVMAVFSVLYHQLID